MRAAQYSAKGKIDFVTVPDPTPTEGQIVVALDKVAVCGSDVTELYYRPDSWFPREPGTSGHEVVGYVAESPDPRFKKGDRVLLIPPKFDGWSQYLSVDPQWLIPIPDSLSMEEGVLAQLLGCVIWALKKVDSVYDKDVAVIGQGPAGLFFTKLLSNMGAKRVIGLDLEDYRLDVAKQMGATQTINGNDSDIVAQVEAITEGKRADLVVEVVGVAETVDMATRMTKDKGDFLVFGIPKTSPIQFDIGHMLRYQQRMLTTVGTQDELDLRSFRLGMDMIADGRVDPRPLISHCLPFGQLRHAFELAYKRTDGAVKVIVEMGE